jgi:hypothetical protein
MKIKERIVCLALFKILELKLELLNFKLKLIKSAK